jgi:hypothetical protein
VSAVEVLYDTYPEGISIETSVNNESYISHTEVIDTKKKVVYFNGGLGDNATCRVKLTLTASGENLPKVKAIIFR